MSLLKIIIANMNDESTIKKCFEEDLDNTPRGWNVSNYAHKDVQKYFKHILKALKHSYIKNKTKKFLSPKLDGDTVWLVCRSEVPFL